MKKIYQALSDFQSECPIFSKDTEGFGYKYTTLPNMAVVVTPLLKKHGLILHQFNTASDTHIGVVSTVVHIESGEELVSELKMPLIELPKQNKYQVAGSAITYMRRYDMSTLLGLHSEKDDDMGGGKTVKRVAKRTTTPKVVEKKEKPLLTPDSEKWAKAKEYMEKSGDTKQITDHYTISDENLELLKK